jgi:redox-sensitive bicupin YhaK (pirin superfamily)
MSAIRTEPVFAIQRSDQRAFFDHGWLQTYHSFSFAEYFDPNNVNWGALRVLNDDTIAAGAGFPPHPHKDMEIVTYVLTGELLHQDSTGSRGVVGPGGVQFMSAGTGVKHSEFNHSSDRPLRLVQMWIVPGTLGAKPSYGQRQFEAAARNNKWLHAVSGDPSIDAPIRITADATFSVARLDDGSVTSSFAPKRRGFLYLAEGAVTVNGKDVAAGDAVRMYDIPSIDVRGCGEILLWDLPEGAVS